MKPRLPLATTTWDKSEYKAIDRVVKSGQFTMGAEVSAFEQKFAEYLESRFCVMVNSGSSANLLAVAALFYLQNDPLKAGDEVIVPAVSWSTTYSPLQQYGLKLKFVDIDIHTLNLDLNQLASAISDKTRLIFAVNLLGNPIDYIRLKKIIAGKNIRLLEDNCESLGASLHDIAAGTFGIAGTFSSFFSHHISTMEGGIIATNNEELYHILLCLRAHGWTRQLPENNMLCKKSLDTFEESFRFILPGYNLRPLEVSGAIGQEQLIKLPKIIEGRKQNARIFMELFTDHPVVSIQSETGDSSWFGFAMILRNKTINRSRVLNVLTRNGIECRPVVAGNFTRNAVIKFYDFTIHGELAAADAIHDRGFFVGNHHFGIEQQLHELDSILRSFGNEEGLQNE